MLRLIVAFMANFDMNYRCDTYINIICAGYLIAVHCIPSIAMLVCFAFLCTEWQEVDVKGA